MSRQAQHAAGLTAQLLAFVRRQVLQPQVLNMNDLVSEINRLLGAALGEQIDFTTLCAPAGLLKYWLGHSRTEDMSDLYDGSVHDEAYRMEMAEKLGTGFVLSCTDCTEKEKEATGAVTSK